MQVERYNLAQDIADFTANCVVKAALNSKGTGCCTFGEWKPYSALGRATSRKHSQNYRKGSLNNEQSLVTP